MGWPQLCAPDARLLSPTLPRTALRQRDEPADRGTAPHGDQRHLTTGLMHLRDTWTERPMTQPGGGWQESRDREATDSTRLYGGEGAGWKRSVAVSVDHLVRPSDVSRGGESAEVHSLSTSHPLGVPKAVFLVGQMRREPSASMKSNCGLLGHEEQQAVAYPFGHPARVALDENRVPPGR